MAQSFRFSTATQNLPTLVHVPELSGNCLRWFEDEGLYSVQTLQLLPAEELILGAYFTLPTLQPQILYPGKLLFKCAGKAIFK